MHVIDNKSVFRTVEFAPWAYRNRLITAERVLIDRYLDKNGRTLEAGTGGGKILFAMKELGFTCLLGFDFVPEFIKEARKRDTTGDISFEIGDAVHLDYNDSSFDQIIYLQQILSFMEGEGSKLKALQEAYRILRPGGTGLFSFLSFDARARSLGYWPYLTYLRILRTIRRSNLSIQHIPWLKLASRFNAASLVDRGPYVYWYRTREICNLLSNIGFRITAIGSTHQVERGEMCANLEALDRGLIKGMLYVVCTK